MVAPHAAPGGGSACDGAPARRTARASLAGRGTAGRQVAGAAGVRARGVPGAQEQDEPPHAGLGPHAVGVLSEAYEESRYRAEESLVFCHPALGTPLDPSKLAREYMRPALARAKITKPFRPWHDLRHTSLTHEAAAGNPQAYVQLKAGHSQVSPSRSGISTLRRCCSPVPRAVARSACSVASVAIPVATSPTVLPPRRPKRPPCRMFATPRVGLEPTTLRLTAGCSAN